MSGCGVDDCERPHRALGYCNAHYQRLKKRGRLHLLRPPSSWAAVLDGDLVHVPLTRGHEAIADAVDFELVAQFRWFAAEGRNGTSYAQSAILGTNNVRHLHRLILEPPDHLLVDHVNGDGLDNRRANLRACTEAENLRNIGALRSHNTSGYLGVGYRADRGRWRAYVKSGGKFRHLGYFDTALDAALGRDAWIRENDPSEFWTYNVPLLPGERAVNRQRESA